MKKNILLFIVVLYIIGTLNNNLFAQNNFIIGMYGADGYVTTSQDGGIITSKTVPNTTYFSSWYNVLSQDGINTCVIFRPSIWDTFPRYKELLTLIKNNGLKIVDHNRYWFKPYNNGSNGSNQYDLTRNRDIAGFNYDLCYSNIYNDITISSYIYGHHLGGELNYKHAYPAYDTLPSYYCDTCNNAIWKRAEVPPQNVNDAVVHFINKRNSLPNTHNQKIMYNSAVHGGYIEGYNCDTTIYQPEDYVKMTNVNDLQRPDIFVEGSYFCNQFKDWDKIDGLQQDGSMYPNPNAYYLGKFRSIDFAKKYFNTVLSEIDFEQNLENPQLIYSVHSNPNIPNANHIWFQAYTSIIHGAKGVIFYDINNAWMLNDPEDIADTTNSKPGYLAIPTDRYKRNYFPKIYRLYISNLVKELRYLVNQNLLSDNANSIVISKTTGVDANGILPASTTYLPTTVAAADARDFSAINNLPSTTTYTNYHRGEDYGIRYTVRTNGTDVIMIASNPNPYSVDRVNFNFSNVANPVMRNATSVSVLFDDGNVTDVNNLSYKTTRSGAVNSTNTAILKSNTKSINSHILSIDFGPFDVKIFKFISTPPSYSNLWTKVYSNNGSGNIGGWGPVKNQHKFIPIDVDGDGAQELLCIQYQENLLSWATVLKYNSSAVSWDWFWSNNGNGLIGSDWTIYSDDKFYTGDFNGDGKDELLVFRNGNTYVNMYKFLNGNFVWDWSNNNSGNFSNNWPQASARYYVGNFDGDSKKEVFSLSTTSTKARLIKYSGSSWDTIWTNGNSANLADAWPVNNSYNYFVGNFDGNSTDDLFSISGESNWVIYLYYSNRKWNWGGSNSGASTVATWSLPFASTDTIISGKIDSDNLSEVMFIKRGTSADKAVSADYSSATLTKRWSTLDQGYQYINDWPIADGVGNNTKYCLIKANSSQPASYLLAMRSYGTGGNSVYLVNMYKSTSNTNKSVFLSAENESSNSKVVIYPNPNYGNFTVSFADRIEGNIEFQLYDSYGKLSYAGKYNIDNDNKISISIDLPSGIYFLRIIANSDNYMGKIILK